MTYISAWLIQFYLMLLVFRILDLYMKVAITLSRPESSAINVEAATTIAITITIRSVAILSC